jgi:hypothetical protein
MYARPNNENSRRILAPNAAARKTKGFQAVLSLKIRAVVYALRHPERSRFSGEVRDLA